MPRLTIIAAAITLIADGWEVSGSAQAGSMPNAGPGGVTNKALPLEGFPYASGGGQHGGGHRRGGGHR